MKAIFDSDYRKMIKRLRTAREHKGYSQKQLAKKLGYSQSYISKVEQGQVSLDVVQLKAFAKALNEDVSALIK